MGNSRTKYFLTVPLSHYEKYSSEYHVRLEFEGYNHDAEDAISKLEIQVTRPVEGFGESQFTNFWGAAHA